MCPSLDLHGPTVTLFGERDELDEAIGDELARRGCSTHVITVTMDWLPSTTHAIFRLGTPTGDQAMLDLAATAAETTRIAAVCESSSDATRTEAIQAAWVTSSQGHLAALVWHEPFDVLRSGVPQLAREIADQIYSPVSHGE